MIEVIIALLLVNLADVHSAKTILDAKDERLQVHPQTAIVREYKGVKIVCDNPCVPYVPLVPDVTSLETVSEIKCMEYMWQIKNQLMKKLQDERCKARMPFLRKVNDTSVFVCDTPLPVGFGRNAHHAEFPHMGAVGWRRKGDEKKWVFKCGSSLISKKFLLTAAHCTTISPRYVTDIVNNEPEVVMLGVENIEDTVGSEERRPKIVNILNIIVHPDYHSPKQYNDIALLEVNETIEFTEFIKPACIWPHKDITLIGKYATITGWGETESGKPAPHLQVGEVEIIDTSTCDDLLKPFHNRNWGGFNDSQMCAGKPGGRVDTCRGDSGGPLSARLRRYHFGVKSLHLVFGITSFGIKCSIKERPGVYTRVASYREWIEKHVWKNTFERFQHMKHSEAWKKTILEDLRDERVQQEKDMETTHEEYREIPEKNPCDPIVPLVLDVSKLKTISEAKCKEYIWHLKNKKDKNTNDYQCYMQQQYNLLNETDVLEFPNVVEYPYSYGGQDAETVDFPHMGAIGWRSKDSDKEWVFKCSGSLISEKFVITAAHCTKLPRRFVSDIVNSDPEVVMLGVKDIIDTVGTETRRPKIVKIENIIVHPDYKAPKKYNDIALLELDTTIEFTHLIKPACLWPHADIKPNGKAKSITGWGRTKSGKPSSTLQVAEVDFPNRKECDDLLQPFRNRNWQGLSDKQMCAGALDGRIDTCQEHSGGPVQVKFYTPSRDAMHLVVGITSFGIRCFDKPVVYTRVASYIGWIEEHVWNATRT